MSYSASNTPASGPLWRPDDTTKPKPMDPQNAATLHRPDILEHVDQTIRSLDPELRELSLDIHSHPELSFEERHAHDILTTFMSDHGFDVIKHYHLETAWKAEFVHGVGGRVIGVNSEMDALPGLGHACGHNLIAISGVGVAIAIKSALQKFNLNGRVILLGTPAEEKGSGKKILLEKGAYQEMSVCLMCHPGRGPIGSVKLANYLAIASLSVEYFGQAAHAASSPWEGVNSLDAATLAHMNISALRQQVPPTHRIHGIVEGKDWVPNIIPDYAKMRYLVRAPTMAELQTTLKRVLPCFEAAGLATGCRVQITSLGEDADVRQNRPLGREVAHIITSKYGAFDYRQGIGSASTDFGHVTYALPSLHPGFAIPAVAEAGVHTADFAQSAMGVGAHEACLSITKALAATGIRVLIDDEFFVEVQQDFKSGLFFGSLETIAPLSKERL